MTERVRLEPPPTGTAQVWWARRQDAADRHAALLDEAERRRLSAYRRDEDKQRFLAGCALAKIVLAGCAGLAPELVRFDRTCRECGEPHGKPALPGAGLEHSVTHSGDLIAVAVARDPVGVDVERLDGRTRPLGGDGDPGGLARMVLAEPERAALAEVAPAGRPRAFLVAWTRKEAVTKAIGEGLRVPFSEVIVAADPPRLVAWPYIRPPRDVTLLDLDAPPGYVAAVAVLGPCRAALARDGSALLAASASEIC